MLKLSKEIHIRFRQLPILGIGDFCHVLLIKSKQNFLYEKSITYFFV